MVPSRFGDESNLSREICSRDRYITHFYCLAVEAGFYSDVVECLPVDPTAQFRFPPRAVRIFQHPVTFGGQYVGSTACVSASLRMEMSRNYSVVPSRFGDESNLSREICSRDRYITHFYFLAVEAGFYSDVVECLPVDPTAQVRFPPRAVGIFSAPCDMDTPKRVLEDTLFVKVKKISGQSNKILI